MRSFRRPLILAATLLATFVVANQLAAQQISLNFSENSGNQGFAGGQMIGPLLTNSATWNNTSDQGSAASGSMAGLINSAGDVAFDRLRLRILTEADLGAKFLDSSDTRVRELICP
jgi:hypothetical protein